MSAETKRTPHEPEQPSTCSETQAALHLPIPRATNPDYRDSHAGRGPDYDRELERLPWERYMKECEGQLVERIVAHQFPQGILRYVDFACGTGRVTSVLEKHAVEAFGIDVSDTMLSLAKAKCTHTTFVLCDITREKPPVESADLITAFRFFGNAQQALRTEALAALWTVLKPGGLLLLNNHRNPSAPLVRFAKVRGEDEPADLYPRLLDAMLRDVGFLVESAYGLGLWFVHHRLERDSLVDSMAVRFLDRLAAVGPFYRYCPDYVLVCRKPH